MHDRYRRTASSVRGSWALVCAALLAVGALSACQGDADGAPPAEARAGGPGGRPGGGPGGPPGGGRATPVSAQVVVPGPLEVTLRASTNLRARERVDVVPKQAGIIMNILVEEGARVREGQALAQLDDAEWVLQAEQSEARAAAAREAAERARRLLSNSLVSEQEVERLISDSRVAEAELGLARLRVDNAQIRAPIGGVVTHRYIERGQLVNTSQAAFSVADLDRLEANVAIPEGEAARVAVGQVARILLGDGVVAAGRVERIRPVVDAESGTVQVTVSVPAGDADANLRPGQFVNVDLVTETLQDRITLPRTSVLVDGAAPRVFIVRDGQAVEREVELGYSRAESVEIRSGLSPGDTVVVVGQDNLRPNTAVRMMELDGQSLGPTAPEGPSQTRESSPSTDGSDPTMDQGSVARSDGGVGVGR